MQKQAKLQAKIDYQNALSQGFWRSVRLWLGRGCNDLLPTDEVLQCLREQPQTQLGLQQVPLEQIVGSSGRANDFDLAFNPRRESSDDRWVNVAAAKYQKGELPPVLLYKVGHAYFVEDGNHRVSVARANGENSIKANVIKIDASSLTPKSSCTRLGYTLDDCGCS